MGISGKPHDNDGFATLAQLEIQRVAFGSRPQSRGEDRKDDAKKRRVRVNGSASRGRRRRWKWGLIPVLVLLLISAMQVAVVPRKRLRLTRLPR